MEHFHVFSFKSCLTGMKKRFFILLQLFSMKNLEKNTVENKIFYRCQVNVLLFKC